MTITNSEIHALAKGFAPVIEQFVKDEIGKALRALDRPDLDELANKVARILHPSIEMYIARAVRKAMAREEAA